MKVAVPVKVGLSLVATWGISTSHVECRRRNPEEFYPPHICLMRYKVAESNSHLLLLMRQIGKWSYISKQEGNSGLTYGAFDLLPLWRSIRF